MRGLIKTGLLALTAVALMASCSEKPQTEFTTAKVEKGNIQTTITATGTIEPVTSVTVGTQVSGIVSKLNSIA